MGTSSKIYKPIKTPDSFNLFQRFVNLGSRFNNPSVFANCTKVDIGELKFLINKYNENCVELTGTIKAKFDLNFQNLFQNIVLIEFGILNVKAHSNGSNFGAEIITHRNSELIDLNLHLPYLSKNRTKESLIDFLEKANEPLCLNFRNSDQIEYTIEKLIFNTFDDKFMDSSWTLNHSNFTYKVSGSTKNKFEGHGIETFRPTSIRLKPSEGFVELIGWKDYKSSTIELLANYFPNELFSLYLNTKNLEILKNISKINTELLEITTKINLNTWNLDQTREDIEYLMADKNSSIEVEHEKMDVDDLPSFNGYIYKDQNNDFETRLYIDKFADEEWINKLVIEIGDDFEYSHNE